MPPALALLAASAIIGIGTHIALAATAFTLAPWLSGTRDGALGSAFFAPFGLVAVLAPLAAAPIAARLPGQPPATSDFRATLVFAILLAGSEAVHAILVLAIAGSTQSIPLAAHAFLLAYVAAATQLFKRSTHHAEPVSDPD